MRYIYIKIVHIVAHGLYQDDALIVMKDKKSDMIRKNLFKLLIDISCRSNFKKNSPEYRHERMCVGLIIWDYLLAMKVDISMETDSMQAVYRTFEETWSCIPYLESLSYMDNALTCWETQFSCKSSLKSYLLSDSSYYVVYLRIKVEAINTYKVPRRRGVGLFNCSSLRVWWRKWIIRKSYWRNYIVLISKVSPTNNKTWKQCPEHSTTASPRNTERQKQHKLTTWALERDVIVSELVCLNIKSD